MESDFPKNHLEICRAIQPLFINIKSEVKYAEIFLRIASCLVIYKIVMFGTISPR
jgi:hypothetical protein